MPPRAVKELELLLTVNSTKFRKDLNDLLRGVRQLKTSLSGVNLNLGTSAGVSQATTQVNRLNKALGSTGKTIVQTGNSWRVFGNEKGFLKFFAIVRSELLLIAFAFSGLISKLKSFSEESRITERNIMGLKSVMQGFGHDTSRAQELVDKFTKTGLMSINDAAESIKMLASMEGVSLDLVDKTMQAAQDWAAFNRLGQYSFGEAIKVFTRGMKEQRSQVSDAIGWVKNLDQAWKEYAASIGTTVGKLTPAQKNIGAITVFLKDSAVVMGDAAKLANTYDGDLSKLTVTMQKFGVAMGDIFQVITRTAAVAFTNIINKTTEYLKVNKELIKLRTQEVFSGIEETVSTLTKTIGWLVVGLAKLVQENQGLVKFIIAIKAAQAGLSALTKLSAKLGPKLLGFFALGGGSALTIITTALTALVGIYIQVRENQRLAARSTVEFYTKQLVEANTVKLAKEKILELLSAKETYFRILNKGKEATDQFKKGIKDIGIAADDTRKQIADLAKMISEISLRKLVAEFSMAGGEKDVFAALEKGSPVVSFLDALKSGNVANTKTGFEYLQEIFTSPNKDIKEQTRLIDDLTNKYKLISQELVDIDMNKLQGNKIDEVKLKSLQKQQDFMSKLIPSLREIAGLVDKTVADDDKTNKNIEALKSWQEALRNYKQEALRASAQEGLARITQDAVNRLEDLQRVGKEAGLTLAQMNQQIGDSFSKYLQGRIADFYTDAANKFNDASKAYQKKINERLKDIRADIIKARVEERKEIINSIGELATTTLEQGLTSFQKAKNELEALRITAKDTWDRGIISEQEYLRLLNLIIERTGQLSAEVSYEASRVWDEMVRGIGDTWIETQYDIRQTESETINQLRRELQRGAIDQEEYALRVANAHDVAATQAYNAWRNAGRGILSVMSNYMTQVMADAFKKTKSISAALNETFSLSSLGMGLATAGISIGLGLIANELFKTKPTPTYEDINPDTTSAETRRKMGSISAASPMYVNIIPTVSFENMGGQIFIGSGSISEFEQEMSTMMIRTMQNAIDSNELSLEGVSPR